jgi:hypothetical protein
MYEFYIKEKYPKASKTSKYGVNTNGLSGLKHLTKNKRHTEREITQLEEELQKSFVARGRSGISDRRSFLRSRWKPSR